MHYIYIIKSERSGKIYCGFSSDLRQRIIDHNSGKSNYTSNYRPWRLVYYEAYSHKEDAQKRERQLKNNRNVMKFLKQRIERSIKDHEN